MDPAMESNLEFNKDKLDLLEMTKNHLKKKIFVTKASSVDKAKTSKLTITEEYMKNVRKHLDWNLDQNFEQEMISPRLFLQKEIPKQVDSSHNEQTNNHEDGDIKRAIVGLNHEELLRLYKENRRHIKSSSNSQLNYENLKPKEGEGLPRQKSTKPQRPSNFLSQGTEAKNDASDFPKRRIKKLETQTYMDVEKMKKFTSNIKGLLGTLYRNLILSL